MTSRNEVDRIAVWLEREWSEQQRSALLRYEEWLIEEALPAGGIGPHEMPRVFDRHIADSLAFLRLFRGDVTTLLDVGTGVGLPAIPLAIALPGTEVVAIDRSGGRASLASRAVRVLELENVTVRNVDAREVAGKYDVLTFRAALRLPGAVRVYQRLASQGGVGLLALSRTSVPKRNTESHDGVTVSVVKEGVGVLDSPAWILKMKRTLATKPPRGGSPSARAGD